MRDPAGNIRPRRLPLIKQLPGNILERDNMPAGARRNRNRKCQQFGSLGMGDDRPFFSIRNHAVQFGRQRIERLPDHAGAIAAWNAPLRGQ